MYIAADFRLKEITANFRLMKASWGAIVNSMRYIQDIKKDALGQPCVSYAGIAGEFGVTRESVRQWHRRFPHGNTGLERRRTCTIASRRSGKIEGQKSFTEKNTPK